MTDIRPVLRTGALAHWDSFTAGCIPCKVLAVTGEGGAPSTAAECVVRLTASRGVYKRGEVLRNQGALHVIPRGALFQRDYGARIRYYTVEPDKVQS